MIFIAFNNKLVALEIRTNVVLNTYISIQLDKNFFRHNKSNGKPYTSKNIIWVIYFIY